MNIKLLTEHHLEFLSLKGGCTGSSVSMHVKMPHCWKSHVTARMGFDVRKPIFEVCDHVKLKPNLLSHRDQLESRNFASSKYRCYTFQKANYKGADHSDQAGLRLCCLHATMSGFSSQGPWLTNLELNCLQQLKYTDGQKRQYMQNFQ